MQAVVDFIALCRNQISLTFAKRGCDSVLFNKVLTNPSGTLKPYQQHYLLLQSLRHQYLCNSTRVADWLTSLLLYICICLQTLIKEHKKERAHKNQTSFSPAIPPFLSDTVLNPPTPPTLPLPPNKGSPNVGEPCPWLCTRAPVPGALPVGCSEVPAHDRINQKK